MATRPAGGTFTFTAKLLGPTSFRLSTGTVAGPVLEVPVAPLVKATAQEGGIGGTVLPARAGTKIQVQVLEGDEWLPAGEAIADDVGSFFAELEVVAGIYRVQSRSCPWFRRGVESPASARMSTRRLASAALAGLAIAVALPAPAAAARFAIGVATPAAIPALQRALGPGSESLAPLPAVVVERAVAPRLRAAPRRDLRRAARKPKPRLRGQRSARARAVAPGGEPRLRFLAGATAPAARPRRGDRLRDRRRPPRAQRPDRRGEELRRLVGS